jgi:hypothetical protein
VAPLTSRRRKRLEEFIAPFRVEPGSKVKLSKDFDPGFKAGINKKKDVPVAPPADKTDKPEKK